VRMPLGASSHIRPPFGAARSSFCMRRPSALAGRSSPIQRDGPHRFGATSLGATWPCLGLAPSWAPFSARVGHASFEAGRDYALKRPRPQKTPAETTKAYNAPEIMVATHEA
jgi:hypothetical protein